MAAGTARPGILGVAIATALGVAALAVILATPLAEPPANTALAITLVALGLWATGVLAEYLTALILFWLVVVSGIAPPAVAFAGFASSALWMIFAGLVIGVALGHSGLAERLARRLAGAGARDYLVIIAGAVGACVALGFVMPSAMGRVMLIMPIGLAFADQLGFAEGSRGRTGIVLAIAFGNFLPAFGILPSNVPNMVLIGAAESLYGLSPGYASYLFLHFPVLGLGKAFAIIAVIAWRYHDTPRPAAPAPASAPASEPPISAAEWRLAGLLALGLALWITDAVHGIAPAWIGLAMAIVCLAPGSGLVPADTFRRRIDFAPVFYVAGIISLGSLAHHTGLGAEITGLALSELPLGPDQPFANWATLGTVGVVIGMTATLPGVPAVLTPLAADLAEATGFSLMAVLMTQVIGYSTLILPYQSPPLMVALGLGRASLAAATSVCLMIAAVTILVLLPLDALWWRLLGWF